MKQALTLYASFDETPKADFGHGDLSLSTRFNHETEKGRFVFQKGFDPKVFRIAKGKGRLGGALEVLDVLPRNGRIFFPAHGNLAYRTGGWGESVSLWINTNPDTMLKTAFCDPVQITEKGANNGGLWIDFPDVRPRDLRLGAFPAVPEGQTGAKESDPNAPMVRVPGIGFQSGDWHHLAITWNNFDTGRKDGSAILYIDGKSRGEIQNADLRMGWDLDRTGIYIAVSYIGLLDELALFNRPLTPEEVASLHAHPELLRSASTEPRP